jgi:hypothetical protein
MRTPIVRKANAIASLTVAERKDKKKRLQRDRREISRNLQDLRMEGEGNALGVGLAYSGNEDPRPPPEDGDD